jgi:hypothetical protein
LIELYGDTNDAVDVWKDEVLSEIKYKFTLEELEKIRDSRP